MKLADRFNHGVIAFSKHPAISEFEVFCNFIVIKKNPQNNKICTHPKDYKLQKNEVCCNNVHYAKDALSKVGSTFQAKFA